MEVSDDRAAYAWCFKTTFTEDLEKHEEHKYGMAWYINNTKAQV